MAKRSRTSGKTSKSKKNYLKKRAKTVTRGNYGLPAKTFNQDMKIKFNDENLAVAGPTAANASTFGSDFNALNSIIYLNRIAQNNTVNGRQGKGFMMHAVAIRAQIQFKPTAAGVDRVSMYLIYDRDAHGTTMVGANIIGGAGGLSDQLTNTNNASRFKMLKRWDWEMSDDGTNGSTGCIRNIEEFIRLKGKETKFTAADTTGAVTNLEKGGLYLLLMGSNFTIASGDAATLKGNSRLYFYNP